MNELEKTVAPEDTVTPTPEVAETENTCIEESSPSSDLAQVADAQTEDGQTEEEKADSRRIHFMSKEELLSLIHI